MLQLSHAYQDEANLKAFIDKHELHSKTGLIQVYSGCPQKSTEPMIKLLEQELANFKIIGVSTSGEIFDGQAQEETIVIDFLVTEHNTQIHTIYLNEHTEPASLVLKSLLAHRKPVLAIVFSNALHSSPEPFLKALNSCFPNMVITGGNAGDNEQFTRTYVSSGSQFYDTGSVCAFLSGDTLSVKQQVLLGWDAIGPTFKVTKANGNHLYSLDELPVMEVYKKYIGPNVDINFPNSAMEFPLLVKRGVERLLRAPVGLTDDGDIIFAGDLQEGDLVSFSFADPEQLIENSPTLDNTVAQAMLMFGCAARKSYLGPLNPHEVKRIAGRSKGAGAFLYGEFSSSGANIQLHNLSQTITFLSESSDVCIKAVTSQERKAANSLMNLAHLARTTGNELNESLNFLKQHHFALDYSAIVSMTNPEGIITYVNRKFEEISGYSRDELLGQTHQIIRHPKMPESLFKNLWETITNKKPWQGVIRNRRKDGSSYFVKTVIVPILDDNGKIEKFLSIRTDITDVVNAKETIQQQQCHPLTHCPNRIRLLDDLNRSKIDCVALYDVKKFKVLNDHWGFKYGDTLIKAIVAGLGAVAAQNNCRLYHINGALFAVTPRQPECLADFEHRVMEIKYLAEENDVLIDDHHHEINFSVGTGYSSSRPVAYAESALLEAKDDCLAHSVVTRKDSETKYDFYFWLKETKLALEEGRIIAVFQEIRALKQQTSGKKKYEALARLQTKDGNLISPAHFLTPLKSTRYYRLFTRVIIDTAIEQSIDAAADICVNVSAQDLYDNDTVEYIQASLSRNRSASIIFEITESEAIKDFVTVDSFIRKMRALGAQIAIDDFGSGYSNFAYLIEIKPDFLKIDGSIISRITENDNSRHVTRGIVEMAKSMGIATVAEFVSSEPILTAVQQCGVNFVQGYYIGKPSPFLDY
ncbi:EAL domain-containing protein [Idiomarina seosinensis]|uniref:sensor domain-containing phosphodiesterase n=1 Tax=Idiomarina seosinensis TaxID=281739 RepID=UPI00384C30C0